jgi:hypothetical protein
MLPEDFNPVFTRFRGFAEGAIASFDDMFKAGKPVFLKPVAYKPSGRDTVSPSSLGYCSRKNAAKRAGIKATNPNAEESRDTLFRTGNVFGLMWASAIVNHAKQLTKDNALYGLKDKWKASIEVDSWYKEANISGRADIMLTLPTGEKIVIECKNSEGQARRSIGDFKDAYLYQIASYMMAQKTQYGVVIVQSKWKYVFYYIYYSPLFQRFTVYDRNGQEIDMKMSLAEFHDQANIHMVARKYVAEGKMTEIPFDAAHWECFGQVQAGVLETSKRPAEPRIQIPNCIYCEICHGLKDGQALATDKAKPDTHTPWYYDESTKRIVEGFTHVAVEEKKEDE